MASKQYKTPVKASKLIAKLEACDDLEAEVVDEGDARPVYRQTKLYVGVDHSCMITGELMYVQDDAKYGVDGGRSEITVLGVTFSMALMNECNDDIEIEGREIEYDNDLTEDDVIEAAHTNIDWPSYDADDYPFEEEDLEDSEIIEKYYGENGGDFYAQDANGKIYNYDSEADIPATQSKIDYDEAWKILAHTRPGFDTEIVW